MNTEHPRNPYVAVDTIIRVADGAQIVLHMVWRAWGFVEYGESVETAIRCEAIEEVGVNLDLLTQFHTYSEPNKRSSSTYCRRSFSRMDSGYAESWRRR